jgi:transmembrane 9 superfamily protein 2/4
MLLIVVLWFGISAPLSAIGSYIGSRQGVRTQFTPLFGWLTGWMQGISHPVRVNQIPRQIPPAPRYLQPWVCRMTCNV